MAPFLEKVIQRGIGLKCFEGEFVRLYLLGVLYIRLDNINKILPATSLDVLNDMAKLMHDRESEVVQSFVAQGYSYCGVVPIPE